MEKRKGKILSISFFFPTDFWSNNSKHGRSPIVFVSKYKQYLRTCCLCLLRWAKGHAYTVKNAVLNWAIAFHRKVLLWKEELIISDGNWYKNNFILASVCETSTILRKSELFPLALLLFLPGPRSTFQLLAERTLALYFVCCWFSIRGLEFFNTPDRPYCWCCVIHRLLISCHSPTPSTVPTSLQKQFDFKCDL